jgi:hypothetical protein
MNKAILNAARRSNSVDGHQAFFEDLWRRIAAGSPGVARDRR